MTTSTFWDKATRFVKRTVLVGYLTLTLGGLFYLTGWAVWYNYATYLLNWRTEVTIVETAEVNTSTQRDPRTNQVLPRNEFQITVQMPDGTSQIVRNVDNLWMLKWNSKDVHAFAQAHKGQRVQATFTGFRLALPGEGVTRNAVSISPADSGWFSLRAATLIGFWGTIFGLIGWGYVRLRRWLNRTPDAASKA